MKSHTLLLSLLLVVGVSSCFAGELRRAIEQDWALQDQVYQDGQLRIAAVARPIDQLAEQSRDLRATFDQLSKANVPAGDPRWLELYYRACERRRFARLRPYRQQLRRVVFTKHFNLGGSHYAYTEAQSDAQQERNFRPGASLCLLDEDGAYGRIRTLINDPNGVIRDPDVSYDGRRVLFSWKKSDREDDYHLYEIDVATQKIRQLTATSEVADYEGVYLPSGEIIFNSTRCVQTVDCWWTEVSNLYTCDSNGQHVRRLTFDQVHTNYPTVTPDGRVLYTRWEYSDRGQIFVQPLFQMNADGTRQTECYGNNSWFPTAILHARAIPGTQRIVAVLSGHHTHQRGKLAIIDPARGRQEGAGVQLIAPRRDTPPVRIDQYGQDGPQFQYPYPLSESAFLVAMDPVGSPPGGNERSYGIYFIDADGKRELLAYDSHISCNQPVPLGPRPRPALRSSVVDYSKHHGVYYVQDVYAGQGLAGVPRGTIKKLRVVAIHYRAAGIRRNFSEGPGGAALASTPISIGNGAWDVKEVLGETPVRADGSACFLVPAQTPVYFQTLDDRGRAVQTMRSWSTLQPGETFACVGCHESKHLTALPARTTIALSQGPQTLELFEGPPRGFSFPREIQPILDRHCVRCHSDSQKQINWDRPSPPISTHTFSAFSLRRTGVVESESGRKWSESYLALTRAGLHSSRWQTLQGKPNRLVSWITAQSEPTLLPPYYSGSARSDLMTLLVGGHGGVTLSRRELEMIACWIDLGVPFCGDYQEANIWTDQEVQRYEHFVHKRRRLEQLEQN